ncbi:flippase [Breznakiella homolactica]|uniref:Flippase n=1 Tax=Breznakiella homolactica TaxID=2798577 RepID=A0A7T7XP55_9SPIR|nr:flippase [Breznakiella homolactica]QQO09832.1 flippase [Breznakiella homolactica]
MPQQSIKKNYFYNLSYQILQLLTPLITVPYLSRVLTAEGIGIQSYTNSVVSYFVMAASLGIGLYGQREIAYNRDNETKKTKVFLELSLIRFITVLMSLFCYFIFVILYGQYKLLFIIESANIIACLFDFTWYYQGMENFKNIAFRNIFFKLLSVVLIFLFIKSSDDLYISVIIGSGTFLIGHIYLAFFAVKGLYQEIKKVNIKTLRPFKHFNKIILLFVPQIAVQIYTVLDKTMIGIITHSPLENGWYEQSIKIIKLLLVIITSLGTVLIPRIANLNANKKYNEIKKSLTQSFLFVFAIGLPMMFGLIGVADLFVPVFFGPGYEKSIILIQILSGLFLAIGMNNVIGMQYLIPVKKEKTFTITVIIGALSNFLLNLILIPKYKAVGAAISSVCAESIIVLIQFFYIYKLIDIMLILKRLWRYFFSSFIMILLLFFLKNVLLSGPIALFVIIGACSTVYILILLLLRDPFIFSILTKILKRS